MFSFNPFVGIIIITQVLLYMNTSETVTLNLTVKRRKNGQFDPIKCSNRNSHTWLIYFSRIDAYDVISDTVVHVRSHYVTNGNNNAQNVNWSNFVALFQSHAYGN